MNVFDRYLYHFIECSSNFKVVHILFIIICTCIDTISATCEITELSKMEGEATVNNRKGKIIFFYEWVLSGNWQGKVLDIISSFFMIIGYFFLE